MMKHMDDKGWRQKMTKSIFLSRQDRLPLMTMRHRLLILNMSSNKNRIDFSFLLL